MQRSIVFQTSSEKLKSRSSCHCNKFEIDFCCLDECARAFVAYVCSAGVIGMWWISRALKNQYKQIAIVKSAKEPKSAFVYTAHKACEILM